MATYSPKTATTKTSSLRPSHQRLCAAIPSGNSSNFARITQVALSPAKPFIDQIGVKSSQVFKFWTPVGFRFFEQVWHSKLNLHGFRNLWLLHILNWNENWTIFKQHWLYNLICLFEGQNDFQTHSSIADEAHGRMYKKTPSINKSKSNKLWTHHSGCWLGELDVHFSHS